VIKFYYIKISIRIFPGGILAENVLQKALLLLYVFRLNITLSKKYITLSKIVCVYAHTFLFLQTIIKNLDILF